jgi:V8-like Glu-specific endopeptidase
VLASVNINTLNFSITTHEGNHGDPGTNPREERALIGRMIAIVANHRDSP